MGPTVEILVPGAEWIKEVDFNTMNRPASNKYHISSHKQL